MENKRKGSTARTAVIGGVSVVPAPGALRMDREGPDPMMDERLLSFDTIVFDVGNVLLSFEPERVASLLPERHREALKEAMFGPVYRWSEFDLGRKPNEQIAGEIALAAGVDGGAEMVLEALRRFPETMEPLPLYRCIGALKGMGKRLYALTNYAEPSFTLTRERFPALQELDGEAVSAREKLCKPEKEFYRRLLTRYGIDPETSLYIDDAEANIRAGAEIGFRVWHYAGDDRGA